MTIALRPDIAPKHAERLKTLTRQGFYDGVPFHRVIAGFMAQTGDPTGTGTGGSDLPDLKAEFSNVHFGRGIVGMARAQDPDSANSQFFIMYGDAPALDGQYTVVGQVVSGMEAVDAIKKGDEGEQRHGRQPRQDHQHEGRGGRSSTDRARRIRRSETWPISKTRRTRCSWRRAKARSSIEMRPDLAPAMSRGSRRWRGRASMTGSSSTA